MGGRAATALLASVGSGCRDGAELLHQAQLVHMRPALHRPALHDAVDVGPRHPDGLAAGWEALELAAMRAAGGP